MASFETLLQDKMEEFCPLKELKLRSQDKPFITENLKILKRQKSREYTKKGKTPKYYDLAKKFKLLYASEAKKYLDKNMNALKETKPGKAYHILKRRAPSLGTVLMLIPSSCPTMNT